MSYELFISQNLTGIFIRESVYKGTIPVYFFFP